MTSRLCGSLIITPRIILWGVGAAHFKCVMFYWENPSSAHIPTVPVNKKFTFRFKETIVLRLTVLSKNGTTTEGKRNGHAIRKRNGMYKKNGTERTMDHTHEVLKTSAKQFLS